MVHTKICPKCLMKKSLDKFKPRPDGKPGGYCYNCEIQYYREYNAKRYRSPESRQAELERAKTKYLTHFKPARMARKRKLILQYGGKCQSCGYNRSSAALDFHHREPIDKARTVSHLLAINQPWAYLAALREAQKCDLLCSNCHREATFPGHDMDLSES